MLRIFLFVLMLLPSLVHASTCSMLANEIYYDQARYTTTLSNRQLPWMNLQWLKIRLGAAEIEYVAPSQTQYKWVCPEETDTYISVTADDDNNITSVEGGYSNEEGGGIYSFHLKPRPRVITREIPRVQSIVRVTTQTKTVIKPTPAKPSKKLNLQTKPAPKVTTSIITKPAAPVMKAKPKTKPAPQMMAPKPVPSVQRLKKPELPIKKPVIQKKSLSQPAPQPEAVPQPVKMPTPQMMPPKPVQTKQWLKKPELLIKKPVHQTKPAHQPEPQTPVVTQPVKMPTHQMMPPKPVQPPIQEKPELPIEQPVIQTKPAPQPEPQTPVVTQPMKMPAPQMMPAKPVHPLQPLKKPELPIKKPAIQIKPVPQLAPQTPATVTPPVKMPAAETPPVKQSETTQGVMSTKSPVDEPVKETVEKPEAPLPALKKPSLPIQKTTIKKPELPIQPIIKALKALPSSTPAAASTKVNCADIMKQIYVIATQGSGSGIPYEWEDLNYLQKNFGKTNLQKNNNISGYEWKCGAESILYFIKGDQIIYGATRCDKGECTISYASRVNGDMKGFTAKVEPKAPTP